MTAAPTPLRGGGHQFDFPLRSYVEARDTDAVSRSPTGDEGGGLKRQPSMLRRRASFVGGRDGSSATATATALSRYKIPTHTAVSVVSVKANAAFQAAARAAHSSTSRSVSPAESPRSTTTSSLHRALSKMTLEAGLAATMARLVKVDEGLKRDATMVNTPPELAAALSYALAAAVTDVAVTDDAGTGRGGLTAAVVQATRTAKLFIDLGPTKGSVPLVPSPPHADDVCGPVATAAIRFAREHELSASQSVAVLKYACAHYDEALPSDELVAMQLGARLDGHAVKRVHDQKKVESPQHQRIGLRASATSVADLHPVASQSTSLLSTMSSRRRAHVAADSPSTSRGHTGKAENSSEKRRVQSTAERELLVCTFKPQLTPYTRRKTPTRGEGEQHDDRKKDLGGDRQTVTPVLQARPPPLPAVFQRLLRPHSTSPRRQRLEAARSSATRNRD